MNCQGLPARSGIPANMTNCVGPARRCDQVDTYPAAQTGNCLNGVALRPAPGSHSTVMETYSGFDRLSYAELVQLCELAAEAMALAQEFAPSRSPAYCELVVACNLEMLSRRRRFERSCGTALA